MDALSGLHPESTGMFTSRTNEAAVARFKSGHQRADSCCSRPRRPTVGNNTKLVDLSFKGVKIAEHRFLRRGRSSS